MSLLHKFSGWCYLRALLAAAVLLPALICARADAEPQAINPIRLPDFTIDLDSPTLDDGVLLAGDVLNKPGPLVVRPAATLRLFSPLDDLDAMSFSRSDVAPGQTLLLLFGVDRASIGLAPPDPGLVAQNRPYNVLDQAAKHQAAGDIFMTLTPFTLDGPLPFEGFGPGTAANNTLVRNQGDTGGVDKDLKPEVSPEVFTDPLAEIDDSDGIAGEPTGGIPFGPRGVPGADNVLFFSITRDSPSLTSLPGTPSGANVYGDLDPSAPGGEFVYASAAQLSLIPGPLGDDIDSLVVIDNGDLVFNPQNDAIIFSLARGSPTLQEFELGPADLLKTQSNGIPAVFAPASLLGLAPTDNIDALEVHPAGNINQEIFQRAIFRVLPGDYNDDDQVNEIDCDAFPACYSGPGLTYDDNGIMTHSVSVGPGPNFDPEVLVVETGDLVQWVWQDGPHNVISGVNSFDGAFHSGPPQSTPGYAFTVIFDKHLENVHPRFQGRYRYFSAPDLADDMTGVIDVNDHPCATFDMDFDDDVDCTDWQLFRAFAALDGEPCPLLTIPEFVQATLGTPLLPGHTCMADMNGDNANDGLDVQPYVDALLGS